MPVYDMITDDAWLQDVMARTRDASPKVLRWALKLICFVGLAVLFAVSVWGRITALAAIIGLFLVILMLSPYLDGWWRRRQFRKSPYYGQRLRIEIEDNGVRMTTDLSRVDLTWAGLLKARRLSTGFLVYLDKRECLWWPDAALVAGQADDVAERLRSAKLLK